MAWYRSALFFRSYRYLPHRWMNQCAAWLMRQRRPQWVIQRLIRTWIQRQQIKMDDFVATDYPSLEAFFLRRLQPGARPQEEGFVSSVDGLMMAQAQLDAGTLMQVKGQPYDLAQLLNGGRHDADITPYEQGFYSTIFLTPHGYHHLHAPTAARLCRIQWIPGRYFPQNPDAVHHIANIYGRNERAVLFWESTEGMPFVSVLVGASLIGSIHLTGLSQSEWMRPEALALDRVYEKGEEIGHFSFGSTLVQLFPPSLAPQWSIDVGDEIQLGQRLYTSATTTMSAPNDTQAAQEPHPHTGGNL